MREKTATKPKTMRLLSLLLVVIMLVNAQGFTSLAATVSRNEVATEEREAESNPETQSNPETESSPETESNTETESSPETESNTETENIMESEISDTTQAENVMQAGTTTPSNPVHNCTGENDGSDTTTWSYVYFGSYPQSEVTDTTIIAAIDSAILEGSGTTADAGIDVWVNGTKYRRISKSDTNYDECFDDVTNNGYRYFKWERIKWRVLNNNGSTLFVVADEALDCKCYNDVCTDITWKDSKIRSWLNGSFYHTAFSSNEQNVIVAQNVVNEDNLSYETEGGNDITDKVYLLSFSEVTNANYGFCSDDDGSGSASRWMQTSAYANARGACRSTDSDSWCEGNCDWWLRSPGYISNSAAGVNYGGYVYRYGFDVSFLNDGVVPALHINLSSGVWFMTDDGTSGAGGEGGNNPTEFSVTYMSKNKMIDSISVISGNTIAEPKEPVAADGEIFAGWYKDSDYNEKWDFAKDLVVEDCILYAKWEQKSSPGEANPGGDDNDAGTTTPSNPVHNCTRKSDGTDTTTWSYVYFGSYPQSEVTDPTIISAIDSAILEGSGTTADAGTDVWVNGTKYRRISKSDTNCDWYFDDVSNNGYRYFKWERIKWRVLNNNGSTLFVAADGALDCKCYNDECIDITWEDSTIRSWLNESFYNTAFSIEEQNAIVAQNVANADNPDYGTEGGNDSTDKVYLLSIDEVTNFYYGFCSDDDTYSASRWMQPSNYARARGTYTYSSNYTGNNDNCMWWLRSPGSHSPSAAYVSSLGYVLSCYVYHNYDGVVPALHINLSSGIWSMTDDGTGGDGGEGDNNPTEFSVTYMSKNQEIDSISVISGNKIAEPKEPVAADGEIFAGWYKDADYNEKWDFAKDLVVKDCVLYAKWEKQNSEGATNPGGDDKNPQTPNGEDSNNHSDKEVQTADIKVTGLKITAPSKKLTAGKKVQLALTISPENATNKTVTWKTSNSKYATIDKNGKLSIKKAGAGKTVTVTATAADGSTVEATYKINIMKHAVKSIKLSAASKSVKAGKSITVKATVKTTGKSVNKTLKWMSSNTKYATVSKSGKVKTKKAGKGKTVTITATSTDGTNKKAKIKIKIK